MLTKIPGIAVFPLVMSMRDRLRSRQPGAAGDPACEPAPARGRSARAEQGFTLVEMLAAAIVLVLMCGMVTTGVIAAQNLYQREQFSSQAQILSDTIDSALSDPFRFMTSTTNSAGDEVDTITFNGQEISAAGGITLVVKDGMLYLHGDQGDFKLLNASAYGSCRVELVDDPNSPDDDYYCSSAGDNGAYRIVDAGDPSRSRTYAFYFAPIGNNFTQELPVTSS